jgi:hypothetical protein
VDNQTFEDIEQYGVERWLDELAQELKSRTYQPQPVRRESGLVGRARVCETGGH